MKYSDFEELRKTLLKQLLKFEGKEDIGSQFKKDFLIFIEKCTLDLIKGEDNFFALFMINVKRDVSLNLSWPIETRATLTNFKMIFDANIILNLSKKEIIALIKHEIMHIMYDHHERIKTLREKYSSLAVNLAMDVSVNQFIKNLPAFCQKIDSVNMSLNLNLKRDKSLETYTSEIDKALKERINKDKKLKEDLFDMDNVHDYFLYNNDMKDLRDTVSKKAFKNNKAPDGLEEILKKIVGKPEISWSKYLKRLINIYPNGYKKTITRKNRRQPDRLDLRGTLRNHVSKILVAIDISGSITDKEIEEIFREIFNLINNNNVKVTLAEIDNQVRRVYNVKTKKDLKPRLNRKDGTKFSPLFKYINDNGYKDYLVIYFTDGKGEDCLTIKPINHNILWVLTGKSDKLSLKKSYGKILKLKNSSAYYEENLDGITIAREMIGELDNLNNRELDGYR